jgi:hypothetical protein
MRKFGYVIAAAASFTIVREISRALALDPFLTGILGGAFGLITPLVLWYVFPAKKAQPANAPYREWTPADGQAFQRLLEEKRR